MITKIEKAVRKAGEHLLDGFNGIKEVSFKGKIDLVTQYDVAVEKILMEELSFLTPEYSFVAEETANEKSDNNKVIYIDPIDGTTNFVHGFPFCCISVGVYDKTEGLCGVVYNPVMGEMYKAEKGGGAYLNDERISASIKSDLSDCLIATGFPCGDNYSTTPEMLIILGRILAETRGIRRAGSAALDLCYTAKGVFDAFYEFNLSPWDIAAGKIIAIESGAKVTGLEISESADLYEKFILSSSTPLHSKIHKLIFS
ncbi:MAG: inositol monophosphatase [Denitrovibrio sp.]|nr:MAG: inositol monophosphatase [Denitrovibrio sp.]